MKTLKELNQEIMDTIAEITNKFPELVKYIIEMQFFGMDNKSAEVNIMNLAAYNESLESLLKRYAPTHEGKSEQANTAIDDIRQTFRNDMLPMR